MSTTSNDDNHFVCEPSPSSRSSSRSRPERLLAAITTGPLWRVNLAPMPPDRSNASGSSQIQMRSTVHNTAKKRSSRYWWEIHKRTTVDRDQTCSLFVVDHLISARHQSGFEPGNQVKPYSNFDFSWPRHRSWIENGLVMERKGPGHKSFTTKHLHSPLVPT